MNTHASALPRYTKTLGYAMAWSFGNWLGSKFHTLEALGNIEVTGLEHALTAIRRGNVIFLANHASVPDDFIVAGAFDPYYLFNDRYFIWSMPDRKTMQSAFQKTILKNTFLERIVDLSGIGCRLFRCIAIDRNDPEFTRACLKTLEEVVILLRYHMGIPEFN